MVPYLQLPVTCVHLNILLISETQHVSKGAHIIFPRLDRLSTFSISVNNTIIFPATQA